MKKRFNFYIRSFCLSIGNRVLGFTNYLFGNRWYICFYIFFLNKGLLSINVVYLFVVILFFLYNLYTGDILYCMDNTLDNNNQVVSSGSSLDNNNQIQSTTGTNLGNSNQGNDQTVTVHHEPSISDGVRDLYDVSQPYSSQGYRSNSERGVQLARYIHNAVKYKKEVVWNSQYNHRRVRIHEIGISHENRLFIQDIIRNNLGTAAHKAFVGKSGDGNVWGHVNISHKLIDMIRDVV